MRKRHVEAEMLSDKNSLVTGLCTEGDITVSREICLNFSVRDGEPRVFSLFCPEISVFS